MDGDFGNPLMGNGFWVVLAMTALLVVSTAGLLLAAWRNRRGDVSAKPTPPASSWESQETRKGASGTHEALMIYFGLLVVVGIGMLLVRLFSGF